MLSPIKILFLTAFLATLFIASPLIAAEPPQWNGPTMGPKSQAGRKVNFIASDLKNGGTSAVSEGLLSAARVMRWSVHILDGQGDPAKIRKHFNDSIEKRVDGIVLGGFDEDDFKEEILRAQKGYIRLIGWHASPRPGPSKLLFSNITTDPLVVAAKAASLIQEFGNKKPGVIIFTDNSFSIAQAKTEKMKEIVESTKGARILEIVDIPISTADQNVPPTVEALHKKYGRKWTHTLAINDIYFDHINFPLKSIKRKDIVNISAGDGSLTALNRIKSGFSQQVATIAEPLHAQGWQVADEMNRAFTGHAESGYVSEPLVATQDTLSSVKNNNLESQLPYQEVYTKIWHP